MSRTWSEREDWFQRGGGPLSPPGDVLEVSWLEAGWRLGEPPLDLHLAALIPLHFTVVDLGCAYAAQSYYFRRHWKYIGVDGWAKDRIAAPNTPCPCVHGRRVRRGLHPEELTHRVVHDKVVSSLGAPVIHRLPLQSFDDSLREEVRLSIASAFADQYAKNGTDYDPDTCGDAADRVVALFVGKLLGFEVRVEPGSVIGLGTLVVDTSKAPLSEEDLRRACAEAALPKDL